MQLFKRHLEEIGIANSRSESLANAFDTMHRALSQLDHANMDIISYKGIVKLLKNFSEIEQVRDVTKDMEV